MDDEFGIAQKVAEITTVPDWKRCNWGLTIFVRWFVVAQSVDICDFQTFKVINTGDLMFSEADVDGMGRVITKASYSVNEMRQDLRAIGTYRHHD